MEKVDGTDYFTIDCIIEHQNDKKIDFTSEIKVEEETLTWVPITNFGEISSELLPLVCDEPEIILTKPVSPGYSSHDTSSEKPYVCNICKREFESKRSLINHKRIHKSNDPHICYVCQKELKNRNSWHSHMRIHRNDQIPCLVCGRTFKCNYYKLKHMKAVHNN